MDTMMLVTTRTYPGGWAKDNDTAIALKRLRGDWRKEVEDYGYHVYAVHPETYCEEIHGAIMHPIGHPPKLIQSVHGRKNKPKK